MKVCEPNLDTPIYLKLTPEMPWPDAERFFCLLTGNGLYFCRNSRFFTSSVPAPDWPSDLAPHSPFIKLHHPRVPRLLFEKVIGFFTRIADRHNAEAAAILVWNTRTGAIEAVVPEQRSFVGVDWRGEPYPLNVHYRIPEDLPSHRVIIGDIHSHVDMAAFASVTDAEDELHRPGVHIVIGRIRDEPPQIHIEFAVDGHRFKIADHSEVLEGYNKRRTTEVPQEWMEKVSVLHSVNSYYYSDRPSGAIHEVTPVKRYPPPPPPPKA